MHPESRGKKVPEVKLTGNRNVDGDLNRFIAIDRLAHGITEYVRLYMRSIRKVGKYGLLVSDALLTFYTNSSRHNFVQNAAALYDEVNRVIPKELLEDVNMNVLEKLQEYLKSLDSVREEVNVFHKTQRDFKHYERKLETMNNKRIKRAGSKKKIPEKKKDAEKYLRNEKKLSKARSNRDEMESSLHSRISHLDDSRTSTMDPILWHFINFQQKYYKRCSTALLSKKANNVAQSRGDSGRIDIPVSSYLTTIQGPCDEIGEPQDEYDPYFHCNDALNGGLSFDSWSSSGSFLFKERSNRRGCNKGVIPISNASCNTAIQRTKASNDV